MSPQTGFRLDKGSPSRLHSSKNVKPGVEIKVPEVDISPRLETLVNEGEGWARAHVRRPLPRLRRPGEPVDSFEVECDEIGNFSEIEFRTGAKKDAGTKNGAHLRLHPEHQQFRVKGGSRPHSQTPSPSFALDITFHVSNRLWNRGGICTRRTLLIFWGGF